MGNSRLSKFKKLAETEIRDETYSFLRIPDKYLTASIKPFINDNNAEEIICSIKNRAEYWVTDGGLYKHMGSLERKIFYDNPIFGYNLLRGILPHCKTVEIRLQIAFHIASIVDTYQISFSTHVLRKEIPEDDYYKWASDLYNFLNNPGDHSPSNLFDILVSSNPIFETSFRKGLVRMDYTDFEKLPEEGKRLYLKKITLLLTEILAVSHEMATDMLTCGFN